VRVSDLAVTGRKNVKKMSGDAWPWKRFERDTVVPTYTPLPGMMSICQ
jgi:hypothetical protein